MTMSMERPVGTEIRAKRAPKKADGQNTNATQGHVAVSPTKIRGRAVNVPQPTGKTPTSGSPIPDAATVLPQPTRWTPHQEPHLTAADLPAYIPDPALQPIIDQITSLHRERQATIKAKTKLILQAKALLRSNLCTDADYEEDEAKPDEMTVHGDKRRKLTKAASKRVDDAFAAAKADLTSDHGLMIGWMVQAIDLAETRQSTLERSMVRLAKMLPAYQWVKRVKGFGDVSFATIVGECGDIGSYRSRLTGLPSIAAVWKRLGLAVIDGHRQGNPGSGATADDWIREGYDKERRSVSWNARIHVIGGMGKWRPVMGDDVEANPDLTEYQRIYAWQARKQMAKCPRKDGSTDIRCSDKGKESYSGWAANRAHRYVEKRMIKHLYLAWRRGGAA